MADDPEPGAKTTTERRSSWRRLTTSAMMSRSPSSNSKLSSTKTMIDGSQLSPSIHVLTQEERQRQDDLISFILDGEPVKGTLVNCAIWYTQYLLSQFRSNWSLLKTALVELDEDFLNPQPGELVKVYDFMLIVAKLLKNQKDLTLVDVVDELDNENMLKPQLDEERAVPNQIVFAALGWLSMFYEAVPNPKVDKLEVTETSTSSYGLRNHLHTRKYYTYRLGFEYIDLPLYNLFSRFGDLIPEAKLQNIYEPPSARGNSDCLYVSSVCFQALHDFAELKIEWVTSLALHLELDSSKKTLKVFQFPSFCRLMTVERKNNILSRLLNDHGTRLCEDVTRPDIPTDKFFEEVLLTYRLIFGQDDRSWNTFRQVVPSFEDQQRAGGRSQEGSGGMPWDYDPLLRTLCGKSCTEGESHKLFEELRNSDTAHYYNPHEFPFFGGRLLELQKLVNEQPAQTVRALLGDRRNVAAWWTIWNNHILIFFAIFTIFFMVLQLIFQIWQVALAKQQLRQASGGGS